MIRVGVVGASGYTAFELLKLLSRHPQVEVVSVTSRDPQCPALAEVHPALNGVFDLQLEPFDLDSFSQSVDVAFSCLPHAASAEIVGALVSAGIKVIDFSADYRLNDVPTFESWYQVTHPDPDRIGKVPYGIPELFRGEIESADLVANPGCFPSSVLIPLVPLFKRGLVQPDSIIVDSKTGISGAGRKANLKFHYPECNESISAYGVGTHRHMPEMEQILQRATSVQTNVLFTPHLTPMDRGILSTIYLQPVAGVGESQVRDAWNGDYQNEPFIRVVDHSPATKHVTGTNFCDLHVVEVKGRVVVLSALDNLIKGASGAAVQNLNVMMGCVETTALA